MCKYPNGDKVTTKNSEYGNLSTTKLPECDGIAQIYQSSGLHVQNMEQRDGVFHVYATPSSEEGTCPYCGQKSKKVHSRYVRVIHDLSILGHGVVIYLEVRKFFCHNHQCEKKTFAEQPGTEVFRYRRRTCRCEVAVARHGISASSNSASRLLSLLGVPVSSSTVLRDLHRMRPPSCEDVREVGVDDWAWRKRVSYGSIVIDLREGRPIDLLGDRERDSFHEWMGKHGRVCLVSRDRSTDYSSAIAALDRPVTEVADKFHLVMNILERFDKLVGKNYGDYRWAVRQREKARKKRGRQKHAKALAPVVQDADIRSIKFREVKELQAKGLRQKSISCMLGVPLKTVNKYCRTDQLPPRRRMSRNNYHLYDRYVEQEYARGRRLLPIFRELKAKGFTGCQRLFYSHYKYLSERRREGVIKGWNPIDEQSALTPVKTLMAIVGKSIRKERMTEGELATMETLNTLAWFREMYEATESFHQVINGHETLELVRWMKRFWNTGLSTLKTFIIGIKKDFRAVRNTIRLNVTNGITEGYVNKLKAVKRVMYGKAGIELLKNKLVLEHMLFN